MVRKRAALVPGVLAVVTLAATTTASAQNFSLSGAVTLEDGSPVKGAVVEAIPSKEARGIRSAKTNKRGAYNLPFIEWGPYRFKASAEGMLMRKMSVTIRSAANQIEHQTSGDVGPDQKLQEFTINPGSRVEVDFTLVPSTYFTKGAGSAVPSGGKELDEANRLTSEQKYAEAEAIVEKLIKAGHESAAAWYLKGLDDKGLDHPDEAVTDFGKALALDPKIAGAHSQLGSIAYAKGDKETAAAEFGKELEISPDATPVAINLAVALRDLGKNDEAVAAWRKVIDMAPAQAGAYVELATLLTDMNRQDEAIQVLDRMDAVVKPDPALWFNLGASFANKDELDRAKFAYAKALALNADFPEANREMGWIKLKEGDGQTAATYFEKYLELRPYAKDADDIRAAIKSAKAMKPPSK